MSSKEFSPHFQLSVSEAFRKLLSEKHLYQSVLVDSSYIEAVAKKLRSEKAFQGTSSFVRIPISVVPDESAEGKAMLGQLWIPVIGGSAVARNLAATRADYQSFELPTILSRCNHCKGRWPFNPLDPEDSWQKGRNSDSDQWFFLSYECQNCKKEPIRFLVRRAKDKLTLCGRSPMESAEVPSIIPKELNNRYGNSVVAAQSGQVLAAIFLLRVFVEQYWLSVQSVATEVKDIRRPTGDEIGEAYKKTLPTDFKERFPTLCEVYSDLSAAMHTANDDPNVYSKACDQVIEHFEARRLFKLI